ncbi:MAG TPA: hypothetical protein PKJ42_04830, partial [Candidatus Goldiibacteriota bacterium]|nr:hypothetical protein [Candidatus Goldiibacteriota bacterium]
MNTHAIRRFFLAAIFIIIADTFISGSDSFLPCGADTAKKLDLMITCQMQGAQERRYYVKIINRSSTPV